MYAFWKYQYHMANAKLVVTTWGTLKTAGKIENKPKVEKPKLKKAKEETKDDDDEPDYKLVSKSPLFAMRWRRVIFDEATNLQNPATHTAKVSVSLLYHGLTIASQQSL